MRNCLDFFWIFFGIFYKDFFGRNFFGEFFWEDFFGRIFWEELINRNLQGIDVLSRFWGTAVIR